MMLQVYDDARTWGQSLSWGWSSGKPPWFKCLHTHTCSHACSHTCAHTCMYTHTEAHTHSHTRGAGGRKVRWEHWPAVPREVRPGGGLGLGWAGLGWVRPSLCPRRSPRGQGAHEARIWSPNQGFESHLWPGDVRGPSACPARYPPPRCRRHRGGATGLVADP